MIYLVVVFLTFGCLVLQSTVLQYLTVGGVTPGLVLVVAVLCSIFQEPKRGTVIGAICGLMEDIFLGRFIGMNALAKGLTSLIIGWFAQRAFRENILLPIMAMFLATLFNEAVFLIIGKIAGLQWAWELWFWKAIPLAIYNTCLIPFIYIPIYNWFTRKKEDDYSL